MRINSASLAGPGARESALRVIQASRLLPCGAVYEEPWHTHPASRATGAAEVARSAAPFLIASSEGCPYRRSPEPACTADQPRCTFRARRKATQAIVGPSEFLFRESRMI